MRKILVLASVLAVFLFSGAAQVGWAKVLHQPHAPWGQIQLPTPVPFGGDSSGQ